MIASSLAALADALPDNAHSQRIAIGPYAVEVGYETDRLHREFHESFVAAAHDQAIDFRLAVASGDGGLRPVAIPEQLDSDIQFSASEDIYAAWMGRFTHALHGLDRTTRRAGYWIDRVDSVPPWERSRPFLPTFQAMLQPTDWVLVHGAGVARNGKGILLAGFGHAGKSSLSLAALQAGWTFCGDDFVAVDCGSPARIAPLYATARLRADMVDRFPDMRAILREVSRDDGELRHELALNRREPKLCADPVPIAAVVLVARNGAKSPVIEPALRSSVLTALMTTTVVATPGYARDHMRKLSTLMETARPWRFDPGNDLPAALNALDDLLTAVAR